MMPPDLERAKRAALILIDQFGITEPEEINLESITWDLGIDIHECSLANSEAQLIRKGKLGVIRIRHGQSEAPRGRFSIGHELGHWVLHPNENQYWICTEDQIHLYQGSAMEVEANVFASELLMPTPIFRPLCRRGTVGFNLADHLAAKFRTSLQATVLRMVDETDEAAIAVLSDGNNVCWSKRNQRKLPDFAFHLEKGRSLHDDTLAWNATLDGDSAGYVDARVWFPKLKEAYRYKVYEDVRYLDAYELTLSLIIVQEE